MRFQITFVALILGALSHLPVNALEPFVPATDIRVEVVVEITIDQGLFRYLYTIKNSSTSRQNVINFFVEAPPSITTAASPSGWNFAGISDVPTANWSADIEGDIAPNQSLSGFTLKAATLPGIGKAYLRGLTPLPAVEAGEDPNLLGPIPDAYEDAVIIQTIGSSTLTFTDAASAIDRIISLKHQSVSLGWLRGDEFIKQLDKKLEQAKKALIQGKGFKARKKLEQFVKKLEQQREQQLKRQKKASEKGKDERFLDDNAFFLLKTNADFIISKLPEKPKDKDEDRESHEGEHED